MYTLWLQYNIVWDLWDLARSTEISQDLLKSPKIYWDLTIHGDLTWHLPFDIWHLTFDIWHLTLDISYLTFDIWHLTIDNWHLTFANWHLTFDICHLSFAICHLPFAIWNLTFDIWHLTFDIWHLTFDTNTNDIGTVLIFTDGFWGYLCNPKTTVGRSVPIWI